MNQAGWMACGDPRPTLGFLRDKATARKQRLFACACCRRFWGVLTGPRSREAVEIGERYADGLADDQALRQAEKAAAEVVWRANVAVKELTTANQAARVAQRANMRAGAKGRVRETKATREAMARAAEVAQQALRRVERLAVRVKEEQTMREAARAAACAARGTEYDGWGPGGIWVEQTRSAAEVAGEPTLERKRQSELLRDFFGNPFRVVPFDSSRLRWRDGAVRKLAAAIYDARRFADLPVLADALEEAGCADAALLAHRRGPGEHVKGCWVVDLLLGKQ
jgi:hypothetical protein